MMDNSINSDVQLNQVEFGTPRTGKRGRPPAEAISSLIDEGSRSHHKLKCDHCNRVFPREKSLSAHRRTHTGEKPYVCTYPSPKCTKSFAQSGQLKTHERLHTNEKCFKCPVEGCETRYRHSNRKCRKHAALGVKLVRSPDPNFPQNILNETDPDVREWLLAFCENKERRHTPKRPSSQKSKRSPGGRLLPGADSDVPVEHPSASRSLHYGTIQTPAADRPDAAPHSQGAEEQDWNAAALQRRSFGSLALGADGNIVSPIGRSHTTSYPTDVKGEFMYPQECVSKFSSYTTLTTTPQRNHNNNTAATTPGRNLSISTTPNGSSHYATPKNKNYISSIESSYCSTPGGESNYGTPIGISNPCTPSGSDCFSTPLIKNINFPGLGSDLTSTPLANNLFTPDNRASSLHPQNETEHELSVKSSPNKRTKSRRGLGPLMEATTDHNVKQEPEIPASHDSRLSSALLQSTSLLPAGQSPSKRAKSRRGLGPLMEATTNNNIKQELASTPSADTRLENSMPLSSPSISSSICDENAYLHNENAPPLSSLPTSSSQNQSLGYTSMYSHQLPPKKMNTYRCLDMEGIKPLNSDEPFASDMYGSNLYTNNTKRDHTSDNHSSPSFMSYNNPTRVAMEMTQDFLDSNSKSMEQVFSVDVKYSGPGTYCSTASPAQHQSKLRATLMGETKYSPLTVSQRVAHYSSCANISVGEDFKATQQYSKYLPQAKQNTWTKVETNQPSDYSDSKENNQTIHLTYNNKMSVTDGASSIPRHPTHNSHSKKVSFAISVHSTDSQNCSENDSFVPTDSFTDEEEDFPSSADHSSISSSYVTENVSLNSDRYQEEPHPVNLSKTSLTSNTTLDDKYSLDLDCTTIDVGTYESITDTSETFPELSMSVMAPQPSVTSSAPTRVTKPCTPTKRSSPSMRNFSPRKVVPKKRWMSRIKDQVSAATASPPEPTTQHMQPRATVVCLPLQQLQHSNSAAVIAPAAPQIITQHMEQDNEPLNLSTR